MHVLLIVNDAPYGSEKAYNAFRLAMTLQMEQAAVVVQIFLMADAVTCALPNQATPPGVLQPRADAEEYHRQRRAGQSVW